MAPVAAGANPGDGLFGGGGGGGSRDGSVASPNSGRRLRRGGGGGAYPLRGGAGGFGGGGERSRFCRRQRMAAALAAASNSERRRRRQIAWAAVFNEAGTVVITNSTFTGNGSRWRRQQGRFGALARQVWGLGGGLFSNGTITVINSTFRKHRCPGRRGIVNLGDSKFTTSPSTTATATIIYPSSASRHRFRVHLVQSSSSAVRPRSAADRI